MRRHFYDVIKITSSKLRPKDVPFSSPSLSKIMVALLVYIAMNLHITFLKTRFECNKTAAEQYDHSSLPEPKSKLFIILAVLRRSM